MLWLTSYENDQIIQTLGDHNHEPVHSARALVEAHTTINNAAKKPINTSHDIVADSISKLSDHAVASLPNLQNLKRTVQQILKRLQNPLPLPENRNSLVIDSLFTKTNGNHTFLQHDSDPIDQCLLIFSTKKQLKMLETFLTTNAVIPTFDEIKAQLPMESEPVLKYCEENYISIGTGSSRSRKMPKFDISLLNVNNNIIQGKHRANTVIEGCNNTFSSLMGCSSLNFWKFIKGLKKEQSFVDAQVIQTDTDTRQARKRDQIRRETHILNLLNVRTTTNYMKKFWL
ncbi:unnamed protein product [Rotaria magnacalcarata]|uniref:MULE transposase domain-containing protein n=1 Tax=Rotaria magnacalcarata TaxID=392030 RepID=A0A816N0U4_9BILA|nr:unnamed protein product [Rotaria magnacalcarata]CAF4564278.1 unnamed protein product [Rotaria magnacalcarata]